MRKSSFSVVKIPPMAKNKLKSKAGWLDVGSSLEKKKLPYISTELLLY